MTITQAQLKAILDYDQVSGVFTWSAKVANCIAVGDIAGCKDNIVPLLASILGNLRE